MNIKSYILKHQILKILVDACSWLNLRYLCSQLVELSLQLFSPLVWWQLTVKESSLKSLTWQHLGRKMSHCWSRVKIMITTKDSLIRKRRSWGSLLYFAMHHGQKMKEPMTLLKKYSPEVLLSGGKPIECLEETKMKYDKEGASG